MHTVKLLCIKTFKIKTNVTPTTLFFPDTRLFIYLFFGEDKS